MLHDEHGNVVEDFVASGWDPVPFGFAGGLYDRDTGLVRFGARDFDSEIARWTARDPIGFGGGDGNVYAYVAGDVVNMTDPTGLDTSVCTYRASTFGINHNHTGLKVGNDPSRGFYPNGLALMTRGHMRTDDSAELIDCLPLGTTAEQDDTIRSCLNRIEARGSGELPSPPLFSFLLGRVCTRQACECLQEGGVDVPSFILPDSLREHLLPPAPDNRPAPGLYPPPSR
jgi:RHS repeat-associated protein